MTETKETLVSLNGIEYETGIFEGTIDFSGETGDFSGDCGTNSNATGKLQPFEVLKLNGSTELQGCMKGDHKAKCYAIKLTEEASSVVYSYTVFVNAEGPHGFGTGNWHLYFIDDSDDRYHLKIWKSGRYTHYVSFNSSTPNIKKIIWSDTAL